MHRFTVATRRSPLMRGQTAVRVARTRVVVAGHDKLVVTYSVQDDTAYLLCPPGEDPVRVLAAARLVLPDDVYHELAWHLEVTQAWPARRDRTGRTDRRRAG